MDPVVVIFGLCVGLLVGVSGMGGGTLMTPLLVLVIGVKPVTAVGSDIAYSAITRTVGGFKHWRQQAVDVRLSTWMACGSIPASIAGVWTLQLTRHAAGGHFDSIVIAALSGVLMLTGVATLARILLVRDPAASEVETVSPTRRNRLAAIVIGVFVGFLLGVTSAGSGALIAVALIMVFRLVPRRVVGTDIFHAAILLWAAAIAHAIAGNIDYGLTGTLLVGSVPGVWIGSHFSARVPSEGLRLVLSVVLLGSGLALLGKTGVTVPVPVIAVVPLIVLVLSARSFIAARRGERTSPETVLAAQR